MVDKSALQSLSSREAKWLFHHYRVMVPPVFFAEILGDIAKGGKGTSTGSGEGDARMLASKFDGAAVDMNEHFNRLVGLELSGWSFPLGGRPIVAAERVAMPDGTFGSYVDQTPVQEVLRRWQAGDFIGMERAFASVWRERLKVIDLEGFLRSTKELRDLNCKTPSQVMALVERLFFKDNHNFANLVFWMGVLGIDEKESAKAIQVWKSKGRPNAEFYAPYTAYLAKLKLYFYLAVSHQVISTRSSNQIDIEYFNYLPFTRVFSSSDAIHGENFPQFGKPGQHFIKGQDLKAALREMADYYDAMPDEEKQTGSFTYADYPPVHLDNAITRTFDAFLPNWRKGANQTAPPRDPKKDAEIMKDLQPVIRALNAHRAGKSKDHR